MTVAMDGGFVDRECACGVTVSHRRVVVRSREAAGTVYLAEPHLGPCGRPCSMCEAPPGSRPEEGICRGRMWCKACRKMNAHPPS